MVEKLTDILGEATCYDCRWRIMFTHVAAGYDILREKPTKSTIRAPRGFQKIKDYAMNKGFAWRAYYAAQEEFSKLPLNELVTQLNEEIDAATEKMKEEKYYTYCKGEPIVVLEKIKSQIANI